MIYINFLRFFLLLLVTLFYSQIYAADTLKTPANRPSNTLVTVNGVDILKTALDNLVKANEFQGRKDTPVLRQMLTDSLINRELLKQNALKLGLDKTPEAQNQLNEMKNNYLVNLSINQHLKANPILETDLKSEYDRQLKILSATADLQEYKISHIVVASENDAKDILAKLKTGDAFAQLAKLSLENTRNNDGILDWILPSQIIPEISAVMVKLSKNALCNQPIQSASGWHIIKLEDKRAFKIPSFEDSKNNIRSGLLQQKQSQLLLSLKKQAKISNNSI